MSILEKLKDLVAALETEQPKEKQEDATEQEQPVDQDVEEQVLYFSLVSKQTVRSFRQAATLRILFARNNR